MKIAYSIVTACIYKYIYMCICANNVQWTIKVSRRCGSNSVLVDSVNCFSFYAASFSPLFLLVSFFFPLICSPLLSQTSFLSVFPLSYLFTPQARMMNSSFLNCPRVHLQLVHFFTVDTNPSHIGHILPSRNISICLCLILFPLFEHRSKATASIPFWRSSVEIQTNWFLVFF